MGLSHDTLLQLRQKLLMAHHPKIHVQELYPNIFIKSKITLVDLIYFTKSLSLSLTHSLSAFLSFCIPTINREFPNRFRSLGIVHLFRFKNIFYIIQIFLSQYLKQNSSVFAGQLSVRFVIITGVTVLSYPFINFSLVRFRPSIRSTFPYSNS